MNRRIFQFEDAGLIRSYDPLAVMARMAQTPDVVLAEAHNDFIDATNALDKAGTDEKKVAKLQKPYWRAYGELVKATRYGFELPPWTEQEPHNLTDENVLELYIQFDAFMADLKKKHRVNAELAATYGAAVLGKRLRKYETLVGLYQNIGHAEARQANVMTDAIDGAFGNRSLQSFEAMFDSPEQAARAFNRFQMLRDLAAKEK